MECASDVALLRRELIRVAEEDERGDAEAAEKSAEYEGVRGPGRAARGPEPPRPGLPGAPDGTEALAL